MLQASKQISLGCRDFMMGHTLPLAADSSVHGMKQYPTALARHEQGRLQYRREWR